MLAVSGTTVVIVVVVVLLLLLGAAWFVLRGPAPHGAGDPAPVAPPDRDLTLPSVERSAGPAPHGATVAPPVVTDDAPVAPPDRDLTLPSAERSAGPAPHGATDVAPTEDLWERTGRTRSLFSDAFRRIRGRTGVGQDTWDELEETLLRADIGVRLVDTLLVPLREKVKSGEITDPGAVVDALRASMAASLSTADRSLNASPSESPAVWLFVGVNGVGKTTTIGKIGSAQAEAGNKVLMAAGDTFRAAAAEQLQTWADRCGADFVRGGEGADPAAVIFDGIQAAAARGISLVLADTAGRLHTKSNLMEELGKVRRVADKAPGTVCEVLLVIDATTGQNGLAQAREFAAATDVTGVVLTKLDGSAKGGIVFAIETELGIPVKLAGLGETAADLAPFDPEKYVSAILG